jgi:glucosylceramidase
MMRYKTIKAAIIILALLMWISPANANLLTNGNFNSPASGAAPTGWTPWAWGNGWANHENNAGVTYNGSYYLVVGANGAGGGGFHQTVSAAAGTQYILSVLSGADAWWLPTGTMSMAFLNNSDVEIGKSTANTVDPAIYGQNFDIPHPWANYSLAATAPVGTTHVKVEFSCDPGTGSVWFENAVLLVDQDPDYNNDFYVNFADYAAFSSSWKQNAPQYDLNDDNMITIDDLAIFAQNWLTWQEPPGVRIITIDPATTFQEIEGFGASLTDSSAWLIYVFLNASERQAVLTDLFDPDDGIGLSYLRQPIGASDFRRAEYTYDDRPSGQTDYNLNYFSIAYDENYIIPTLEQILSINPNVKIMGSPWSPPAWMKTSGQIGWGNLKSDVYPTYANYFVKFIQAYAAHGISIDAVTLQNEPYYEPGSYAGCRMEPDDQIKLVKEMGPAFANNNISTKILVWDHNWDNTDFSLSVLADSTARAYIDGVAWHHYGGNVSAQTTVHNAYPDKSTYFTEGSDGTWNDGGFDADLIRNGIFVVDTIRNWARTIVKWNLALDQNNGPKIAGGCDTCYGVVTINRSSRQVTPRPHYYALGHASKFLRPGAVRIACADGNIRTVAFKNTDGSLVLYAVNSNTSGDTLKLEWNGQWVVSAVPARSIMTFRWDNEPNAKVDVYLTTGDQTSLLEHRSHIYFHN